MQGRRVGPGGLGVEAGAVGLVQEGVQVEGVEGGRSGVSCLFLNIVTLILFIDDDDDGDDDDND